MRVLTAALLLAPGVALASSALDGTWKTDFNSMKVMGRPDVYLLTDGEYTCSSCSPELKVKADGVEHAVAGHAYYDTAMVKVVSPSSDEIVLKQGGKEFARITETVSADGKTLTQKFTNHVGAKVVTGETVEKRTAAGPPGSHAVSGSWLQQHVAGNETMRTVHYEMTADGFRMSWNGQSYDAKFDDKEYPVTGDPGHTTVTLKKIDDGTVEEIDHRQGKVVDEIRLSAGKDGKTIAVTDRDMAHGQTTTYTLDKQP
jgi:uncharacterized protein (DUF2141 family)